MRSDHFAFTTFHLFRFSLNSVRGKHILNVLNDIKIIHCCCVIVMFLLLMLFDNGLGLFCCFFFFSEEKQSLRFTIFKSVQIHLNALSLRTFY